MGVDIATVVLHRALVQIFQDDIADLAVVSLEVSVAPPLPGGHPLLDILQEGGVQLV